MKATDDIEVIEVPATMAELAARRCRGIKMAAISGTNFLDVLIKSCYLQGLTDGYDAAMRSAEVHP